MSVLSRMKGMWAGLVSMLKEAEEVERPTKPRIVLHENTRPDVRAALGADPNYEVVDDKPMPRALLSKLFGYVPRTKKHVRLRGHGYVQGETFDVGINRAKRAIKAIKDKRERKAARTRFIQRLRDSGIKS